MWYAKFTGLGYLQNIDENMEYIIGEILYLFWENFPSTYYMVMKKTFNMQY